MDLARTAHHANATLYQRRNTSPNATLTPPCSQTSPPACPSAMKSTTIIPAFLPSTPVNAPKAHNKASFRCPKMTAAVPTTKSLNPIVARIQTLHEALLNLESLTRPSAVLTPRFANLPSHVQTPSQMLGRLSPGCEGTKGVFPRCNFACTPCYHSSTANKVRVDGMHTVTEVARQMQTLQKNRGDSAHCQLIGGEVSLLTPEDHAAALEVMRFFGRIPMSFTHGDFDYDYLQRLALDQRGRSRFQRLDFAVHFDIGMRGRRDAPLAATEKELNPFRRRFVQMFRRLRKEHGVHFYLAHNMTVQETNLPHLAEAVQEMRGMGFRLLSFQPAAQQGNERRWVKNLRSIADDHGQIVWEQIESGMGTRLPYKLFQMGDERCNRMCVCAVLGVGKKDGHLKAFPLFDDQCEADIRTRDILMNEFGNIALKPHLLYLKVFRTLVTKPWLIIPGLALGFRIINRAGGMFNILRRGFHILTIVMHRFMDADDVQKAWDLMEQGVESDDTCVTEAGPRIRETMERLGACSYAMAHPEEGRLVPACVQHSVYDPQENDELANALPLKQPARSAREADLTFLEQPQCGCGQ